MTVMIPSSYFNSPQGQRGPELGIYPLFILKLIMFVNESPTFFVGNLLLSDISNFLKRPYPGKNNQKRSIFSVIFPRCRSVSKLVRNFFKNVDNFSLCFKFVALIVFDLLCSQNIQKLYFFILAWKETLFAGIGRPLRKLIWSIAQHCGIFFSSDFCSDNFGHRSDAHRSQFIEKLLEILGLGLEFFPVWVDFTLGSFGWLLWKTRKLNGRFGSGWNRHKFLSHTVFVNV